jgi:protein involved in polysaccharide export with SLBB domain
LSDLIKYADGFLPAADLSSIRVHRRNTSAGEQDPELDRLLRLSRGELTNTEYVVLQTKLASLREDYRVDWTRLLKDPAHLDLLLRDGDIVRVERLVLSVRVDGEVRRPGILSFNPGLTMRDYVSRAGGFTDRAWVGKARVTRAANGQVLPAQSVGVLDPGDFIWIPERPDVTTWQQAQSVLTSLAYVATIVIAIRSLR